MTRAEILDVWLRSLGEPLGRGFQLLARCSVEDLARHAQGLGIEVVYREGMPTLGLSFVNETRRFIVIDSLQPREMQAFTLAHEIGHHQLHHATCSWKSVPEEEFEANVFATAALIRATHGPELQGYLDRNPEARVAIMGIVVLSGLMVLGLAASKLFEWFSPRTPRMEKP